VARRARGILVHSEFARRYLEAFGCRTPVFIAPHGPLEEPHGLRRRLAERRVAERLGERAEGELLVGVLGDLGGAKAIDAVLRAVLLAEEPMRLAIVGRRIPGFDARAAADAAHVSGRVLLEEDVSDHEFWAWLRACDVVVNLRHPHRGEVSGTLVRAMQAGKPTVVSAAGTYLDIPAEAVVRVPGGSPDPVDIARVLRRLMRLPDERRRVGAAAREYMERLRAEQASARGYAEAIRATLALLRDPARAALGRWADALSDLGATAEDVHAGLGARYVEALEDLTEE
jgi:glycosyltransferase involved in cell wall biosynthesis